jgi:hypothetical protein
MSLLFLQQKEKKPSPWSAGRWGGQESHRQAEEGQPPPSRGSSRTQGPWQQQTSFFNQGRPSASFPRTSSLKVSVPTSPKPATTMVTHTNLRYPFQ